MKRFKLPKGLFFMDEPEPMPPKPEPKNAVIIARVHIKTGERDYLATIDGYYDHASSWTKHRARAFHFDDRTMSNNLPDRTIVDIKLKNINIHYEKEGRMRVREPTHYVIKEALEQ